MIRMMMIATVALSVAASTAPAHAASADEEAVKALEAQFAKAVGAKNVDEVMKVYAADESLLVFDVITPRQFVGAKAYRKDWEEVFSGFNGPIKFEISDLALSLDKTLGYGHSIQHLSGTDTKGNPIDMTVRVTDVYRKIKGHWLVVHEHVSVPIDLESGKPDMASKP